MKYVKVKNNYKNLNLDYGYCLRISTVTELWEYISQDTSIAEGLKDYINSKSFMKNIEHLTEAGKQHCKTSMGELISNLHSLGDRDLITVCLHLATKKHISMMDQILNDHIVYIQKSGGWFVSTKDSFEYSEIIESNTFPEYTEKDIHIEKYVAGRHFYPFVGNHLVRIDGVDH